MDKKLVEVILAFIVAVVSAAAIYGLVVFLFWNVVWATQIWQQEILQCTR